jgi:hypothetical protein
MVRAAVRAVPLACVALFAASVNCADAPASSEPATRSATANVADPALPVASATAGVAKAPASKRVLGRWELNLNEASKDALTKDFQRFKQSKDLANMVRVEYTVTDTDWILRKYGAGGVYDQKWKYQVLREDGDALLLERFGDDGATERVEVKVIDDTLMVATGNGTVPLRRMK